MLVWKKADTFHLTGIDTAASETEANSTDIASCSVEGAYPAPDHVTVSVGDQDYKNLTLVDGVATLALVPQNLRPGNNFDEQPIKCSYDILLTVRYFSRLKY